ncbi:MAG: phosphate/phosphite/phosphonate ABC transporter substrate-binding protein [Microbacterium sp.]
MKKTITLAATALAVASIALVGCSSDDDSDSGDTPDTLVLAMEPSDETANVQASGETIAKALTDALGIDVEVTVPTDYAALITALGTGQADIAFTAPASMVQAIDNGAGTALLQATRDGSRSYVSQWYTNDPDKYCDTDVVEKEETIDSSGTTAAFKFCNGVDTAEYGDEVGYDALKKITPDTKIAFVDEGSASGYQFPVVQLEELGVIDAPEDLTGVTFAGGHPQAVLSVARGEAEIGTSYDDARVDAVAEEDAVNDLVVFAWSTPIPNDGVVVASDLDSDLQAKIKTALQGLFDNADAKEALYSAYEIDGFDEVDSDALDLVRKVSEQFGE